MAPLHTPFLEVTVPDDDMEISSDAGRVDQDNDIDLLDGDDDIDYMLEDTHSEQDQSRLDEMPDAGGDDIMYDDDLDEITYAEEEMHEDVAVPDEHLTDVSGFLEDPGFSQFAQPVAGDGQATPTQVNLASFDTSTANGQQVPETDALVDTVDYFEAVQEEQNHDAPAPTTSTEPIEPYAAVPELETQERAQEKEEQPVVQEPAIDPVASPHNALAGEPSPPASPNERSTGLLEESTDAPQLLEPTNPISHDDAPEPHMNDDKQSAPAPRAPVASPKETELSAAPTSLQEEVVDSVNPDEAQIEAVGSPQQPSDDKQEVAGPRDAGPPRPFHTTVVDYEGAHISLFPPMEEDEADTFLLGDISLADKTLVDLFRACRQVLGDSVNEDLELEIYCEDLDLTISEVRTNPSSVQKDCANMKENSTECLTTCFSQLVDVYVTLSQQDGIDHPEPFSIILAKKPRWTSRLSTLYLAAAESKGLSAVQADQYLEDYAEADDDYEDNGLDEYEDGPAQTSTDSKFEEDENVPAQSSTESIFEDVEEDTSGETTEAQDTDATAITDTEPAHDTTKPSEDRATDEAAEDHVPETEEIDTVAQAENDQLEVVEQDNLEAEPEAELEVSAGDDSLDQTGGNENGDNESSGSSTAQGENDQPPSSQYSHRDDFDDDDSWLMDDEDTVHEGLPEHLPPASGLEETNYPDSFSDVNAEDQATALVDDGEWPEVDEEAQLDDSYSHDAYDQERRYEDAEVAAQGWDQVDHVVEQEEVHSLAETSEQVADSKWATFDEELDFDVGAEEQHAEEAAVSVPENHTSSGTFRVPDDSAGEEDEDSITYDDDELDLPPQSKPETVHARSSSQSPLGKRSRDDDDSDQESKRLKSQ